MIMIIMSVGVIMCVWVRNSSYIYHESIKIYADSISQAFEDDPTFTLSDEKFEEIKLSVNAQLL